jgi:hypothetical protein
MCLRHPNLVGKRSDVTFDVSTTFRPVGGLDDREESVIKRRDGRTTPWKTHHPHAKDPQVAGGEGHLNHRHPL